VGTRKREKSDWKGREGDPCYRMTGSSAIGMKKRRLDRSECSKLLQMQTMLKARNASDKDQIKAPTEKMV
jgi:hypothetical protein